MFLGDEVRLCSKEEKEFGKLAAVLDTEILNLRFLLKAS
jgi:hypothetical protein